MPGLEDIDVNTLSLDQLDSLSRGETSGLLPEVSPVSAPAPETKLEPKPEPKAEPAKVDPAAKAVDAKVEPADDDDGPAPADPNTATIPYQKWARDKKKLTGLVKQLEAKTAEERAASAKELTDLREKFARGDERLRLLSEVMQPAPQEPENADPEPDPAQDILGWIGWQRRELERVKEGQQKTSETFAETQAVQTMRENYQRDAAAFAQEKTDFPAAYNHLLTTRAGLLNVQGYNEQQIRQILQNEERGLVERAQKAGKRPSVLIYELATQMGHRAPAPAPDPAPVAAANGHANGNGAEVKPSVVEEVERIQRGMDGSKSLANVGGAPQEVSVEALAAMSDKEFAAHFAKHQTRVESLLGKRGH